MKSYPLGRPRRVPTKEWMLSLIEIDDNGCWLWQGTTNKAGYGVIKSNYKQIKAHRLALELIAGLDIPDDKLVCHHCDVKNCINPEHLYIGTPSDNNRDRLTRNPSSYTGQPIKKICKRGHLRTPENLWGRSCKLCYYEKKEHESKKSKISTHGRWNGTGFDL